MTTSSNGSSEDSQDQATIAFAAPDIDENDIAGVVSVLRSGWITTGQQCVALEEELAAYLQVPYVVTMSSCTAALETALAFLKLPQGARIGVPTWTFVSSALAGIRQGFESVLLDVSPDTLNVDPTALAAAIDDGLDAVVGVHFGGVPFEASVHQLCAEAGIPLVEDAAHALGAVDHRGRVGGSSANSACFSFYATKNLTSAEGGALSTTIPELSTFARSYRLHGLSQDAWARYSPTGRHGYDLLAPGMKGNLPDVLAVLARSQLARFDALQDRRRQLARQYRRYLEPEGIDVVPHREHPGSADHLFVVKLPASADRDSVIDTLKDAGIGTSVHFQPLHRFEWFQKNAKSGACGRRQFGSRGRSGPQPAFAHPPVG